jgi:putative redox protein
MINIKNIPEGYQSIIYNGKHSILGDEPISVNGTDMGMSPTELVLTGLAMCKVATIRHIARKNGWDLGDVKANLVQDIKRESGKLKPFVKVSIIIDGKLTNEQNEILIKEADNCYVHRLLNSDWNIAPAELNPTTNS